jgi:hypothetical protein
MATPSARPALGPFAAHAATAIQAALAADPSIARSEASYLSVYEDCCVEYATVAGIDRCDDDALDAFSRIVDAELARLGAITPDRFNQED